MDHRTTDHLDYLLASRPPRLAAHYFNNTVIPPMRRRKAVAPADDGRDITTSHRPSSIIARLFNTAKPLTMLDLQQSLRDHRVRSTTHYDAITPPTLPTTSHRDAYYDHRIGPINDVLNDRDVGCGAAAASGESRYYDDRDHLFCCSSFDQ